MQREDEAEGIMEVKIAVIVNLQWEYMIRKEIKKILCTHQVLKVKCLYNGIDDVKRVPRLKVSYDFQCYIVSCLHKL